MSKHEKRAGAREGEIERLAQERQAHWRAMGESWSPSRADRVIEITRLLNGHAGELVIEKKEARKGAGLFGDKRNALTHDAQEG
jgi:hypothetical protein